MTITLNGTTGITTPAVTNDGAYTGDGISFADGTPSNTLVTNTSGNVGIGTSSPSSRLDVQASQGVQKLTSTTGTNSVYQQFVSTGGNAYVGLNNSTGADFGNAAYALQVYHAGAYPVVFSTNNTERMRIDSAGQVYVRPSTGGTGYTAGDSGLYSDGGFGNTLRLGNTYGAGKGFAAFYNGSTAIGSINAATASSTSYVTSSDYRLKENIAPMTGALAKVALLKPCTYTWKIDGSEGQGFIAHELQEIVPECVVGEKDAVEEDGSIKPQGIDTSFLVATLTAAIQELKAELDTVKTELATLKGTA